MNITYDHEKNEWQGLTLEYIQSLEAAYPLVDVTDQLRHKMPCWIRNNPKKGRKKLWTKFINNWLSRDQARKEEMKAILNR